MQFDASCVVGYSTVHAVQCHINTYRTVCMYVCIHMYCIYSIHIAVLL